MSAVGRPAGPRTGSRLQELVWNRRAGKWDHHGVTGLGKVLEAVLEQTHAEPGTSAVDLGCGTGTLALPLAERGVSVTGVDLSRAMIELLEQKAAQAGLHVTCMVAPVEHLDLPEASTDLVVSNYTLHHLRDADKQAVVQAAARWLRPGGRLVIGDMMFGRGATARDRAIIGSKALVMLRRGPAGWWRLAKNVGRFSFRLQERPVSMDTWIRYLESAGFTDVQAIPVVAEAAVVSGTKPSS